ncbi:hypothetical protein BCR44DRAFT_85166 [Catenaria anguillulae PL171]|uniref:RRM domain-containing protein n=1 Tax=Catenaria anguillulae PL171 TaxID=765915 RepID=A0A1Y2HS21_9FUNG|nr:hypothetical protein BCR44DRAFT_85166 [Catenaria anguillulae PL171]
MSSSRSSSPTRPPTSDQGQSHSGAAAPLLPMDGAITAPPNMDDLASDPRVYMDKLSGFPRYQDDDGVEWELDYAKRCWFPVVTPDLVGDVQPDAEDGPNIVPATIKRKHFLAEKRKRKQQQDSGADQEAAAGDEDDHGPTKRTRTSSPPPTTSAPRPNTSIYLSPLPPDVTASELHVACSKYGIILDDLTTGIPKIKLYTDPATGKFKGDALVTYYKPESVALAIQLLDDCPLRASEPEHPERNPRVRVSEAQFREKSDEEKKKAREMKMHVDKRTLNKKKQKMDRKLDWFDEGPGEKKAAKFAKVVVLKGMYTLDEIEREPEVMLEIAEDVRGECEKVGEVTSLTLYDGEPDGIILVRFKEPLSALACIQLMNGRFFGGQQVVAELYDGTKYKRSKKNDADDEARLQAYEKWLEQGGNGSGAKASGPATLSPRSPQQKAGSPKKAGSP